MRSNNSGIISLIEHATSLSINDYIKEVRRKIKEDLVIKSTLLGKTKIYTTKSKTGFGGVRYWFLCPMCRVRIGKIYLHPISQKVGCRKCLDLEYKSRRYKGMIESA